jgi:hypothetical protein
MADSILVATVSILAGAVLGGIGQATVARYAAFKEAGTVAASIRAELVSLRELIERRNYIPTLDGIVGRLRLPLPPGVSSYNETFNVSVTQDYFQVFTAHVGKLGTLGHAAASVVSVYTLAKSVHEDLRTPSGFAEQETPPSRDVLLAHMMELRRLMHEVLTKSGEVAEELQRFQQRRWLCMFP